MSETSVGFDFIKSFNILSEFGLENVGGHLKIFTFSVISDSVEEPSRNSMSFGVVDYVGDGITLLFSQLSGSEARVNSENFTDQESKSSANTLNFVKCKRNGSLTINIGVQNTVNVFEVSIWVFNDQRHVWCQILY